MKNRLRSTTAALVLAGASLIAASAQGAPQTYQIDPVHSHAEFTIRHLFSKVTGSFVKFQGKISYDAANPAQSTVQAEIDASSIDTNSDRRDNHLRSADFFDVAKYPTITFTSTKVTPGEGGKLLIEGQLTMHGVSKPVTLDGAFLGAGPGLNGGSSAGFEASTQLDRKEFGIVWNKSLDQGGTLLGDDVKVSLEIEGVQAPAAGGTAPPKEASKSGK